MKKKFSSAQQNLDGHKGNIDWMNKEQSRLKSDIKTNEKDKVELKKEMKGRDNTILEKEKEITILKKDFRQMENTRLGFISSILFLAVLLHLLLHTRSLFLGSSSTTRSRCSRTRSSQRRRRS